MRKIKVAELVEDFKIYPRASVDPHHVNALVQALKAGATLPPIVIDRKSKRVIDGFHRCRAHRKVSGEDCTVEVVEKTYKTEAELFLDAARLNASHGLRMDTHDKTHCALLAIDLGIADVDIADALHVDIGYIGSLRVDRTATAKKFTVPIKRTIRHMAGRALTQRQVEANDRLSGMQQSFYVNQVIELLESDMLDTSDDALMARIERLKELLESLHVAA